MAYHHRLGTSNQPIEILDSDEESHTLGFSSFIDLTQDDLVLPQTPPILQQSAIQKKDSLIDAQYHSHQPSELVSQQYLSVEGQIAPRTLKNEAKTFSSPTVQRLHPARDDLIEQSRQLISEDDADSEPSDIMDRPIRHRLKRQRERISDKTRFSLPTSTDTTVRALSFGPANADAQEAHDGEIRRWIRVQGAYITILQIQPAMAKRHLLLCYQLRRKSCSQSGVI